MHNNQLLKQQGSLNPIYVLTLDTDDIFLRLCAVLSHVKKVFGQKFPRNAKNVFECLRLIYSAIFSIFNTQLLFRSWIGSRVKIRHYFQSSNLFIALLWMFPNRMLYNDLYC